MSGLPNDVYGHPVSVTSDGTYDYYMIGGGPTYKFATGTPLGNVYVSIAIQWNMYLFNQQLTEFINKHYDLETRVRWLQNYQETKIFGWTQRQAYIETALTWGSTITAYAASYVGTLMAQTDPNAILAMVPDFSALEGTDPRINLLAYIQLGTS